jgi:hypothetical protein
LTALIPFKPKDYEATFSNKEYRAVFRDLMCKADSRIVLHGSLRHTNAGYVAVGKETLDRSDFVLTIWDGEPAQGRGGTPEVLQSALKRRRPIIWISATDDCSPRLFQRSAFGPCPLLANIARRARPLHFRSSAKFAAVNLREICGSAWRSAEAVRWGPMHEEPDPQGAERLYRSWRLRSAGDARWQLFGSHFRSPRTRSADLTGEGHTMPKRRSSNA